MPDDKMDPFPELIHHFEVEPLAPVVRLTPLHELSRQARIDHQIALIGEHHERIAKSIKMFWGHKDCVEFLEKLVLSGGDGAGKTRIGFKLEVVEALINLATLHEVKQD